VKVEYRSGYNEPEIRLCTFLCCFCDRSQLIICEYVVNCLTPVRSWLVSMLTCDEWLVVLVVCSESGGVHPSRGRILLSTRLELQHWTCPPVLRSPCQCSSFRYEDWTTCWCSWWAVELVYTVLDPIRPPPCPFCLPGPPTVSLFSSGPHRALSSPPAAVGLIIAAWCSHGSWTRLYFICFILFANRIPVSIIFFHLPETLPDYVLPHLSLVQSHEPKSFNHF